MAPAAIRRARYLRIRRTTKAMSAHYPEEGVVAGATPFETATDHLGVASLQPVVGGRRASPRLLKTERGGTCSLGPVASSYSRQILRD